MEAHVHGHLHKLSEFIHIVDALRLNEVGSRLDLHAKTMNPEFKGICKGVGCRPYEEFGRFINLFVVHKLRFIPHLFCQGNNELHAIYVIDIFCLRMISETLMVP